MAAPRSPLKGMRTEIERMLARARERRDPAQVAAALKALVEICDRMEDWASSRRAAEELVGRGAADAQTWASLGDACRNQGDDAPAAQAYAQATALAPDEPALRRNYAETLTRLGRLGEATLQLDVATRLDPGSPYLALRWADLAAARGKRTETS